MIWRPLTTEDIDVWAALIARAETVDATGENYSTEDLVEELANPTMDIERDTLAVFDGPRMIGSAMVGGTTEVRDVHGVHTWGLVDPACRGRGIGRRLLEWQLDRGAQLHAELHPTYPARIEIRAHDHVPTQAALARAAGLEPVRHWFTMERRLTESVQLRHADLSVLGFTEAYDDAVRRAHNEAFGQHFGSTTREPESWAQWFTGSRNFRPDLSVLVLDGPEVAAYLLSYVHDADTQATGYQAGYVGQLGTRPPWRGRGLGSALLSRALAAYQAAGCERATLDVDSVNDTGALGLYERLGFTVAHSQTSWVRSIAAAPTQLDPDAAGVRTGAGPGRSGTTPIQDG